MQQGPITTILVHNMINSYESPNRSEKIPKMQYEKYSPPTYKHTIPERMRCRSFYLQKSGETKKNQQNKQNIHKSIQTGQLARQPKKVDVEFEIYGKNGPKKSSTKSNITANDYYAMMANSMEKYIYKIEKGKKKKIQKCQKIKQFGVNIKPIQSIENQYLKDIRKMKRKGWSLSTTKNHITSVSKNQISLNQQQENSLQEQITLKAQSLKKNKLFSKTISATSSIKKNKFLSKKVIFKIDKEQNTVKAKIVRMISSFSVILSSYGVRIDEDNNRRADEEVIKANSKKLGKFSYYVGKGNNKNLIISILKKRWWWTQAEDMSSADFVWTQIKVSTILQKQSSMFFSELEQVNPSLLASNKQQIISQEQKIFQSIFHPNQSPKFFYKLSQNQSKKYLRSMKIPSTLHNHYEANYMLGNKKALFYNICEYKQFQKKNQFQFIPLTFHIEKIKSKAFKIFEKKAKQMKKALWIVKPGENSNRGQGIFVTDSIDKIKKQIEKNKNHTFIIQKYLKKNFTFQRRKFDIRTFLLMVSIGGVKKFFWYAEGYLRTSSQIYDLTDLDDPFIHLTNDAIQMNGNNYSKFEKDNKITYHEFQRYLDINYPNQKHSVSKLNEKMKQIAREVVQATYIKLDPCHKQCSFELFGMDFLIDSNFKPWLLEVNTNPCLQFTGPVLQRLMPRMLQNLFRIAVDPVFQPKQNEVPRNLACYIPESIIERNRFELIFDSMYDHNQLWEEYSLQQNSNIIYQDENQEFESDGQQIKIDD